MIINVRYKYVCIAILTCILFSCGGESTTGGSTPSPGGEGSDSLTPSPVAVPQINIIDSLLSKEAKYVWDEILEANNCSREELNKILENDLLEHEDLSYEFDLDSKLLNAYYDNINSDFRYDVQILKYLQYSSNLGSDFIEKYSDKNKYLSDVSSLVNDSKGENLKIEGNNIIKEDRCIGTIENHYSLANLVNYSTSYTIECEEYECCLQNNPILFPKAKYIITHGEYEEYVFTDEYGRKVEIDVEMTLHERDDRNVKYIRGFREVSKQMQIDGGIHNNGQEIKDNGGHIIPFSWGGHDEWTNLFAQNEDHNQGKKGQAENWKDYEDSGLEVLLNGGKVKLSVAFEYPDDKSLRPSRVGRSQWNDGYCVCNAIWSENKIEFGEANEEFDEESKSFFSKFIDWIKSLFS